MPLFQLCQNAGRRKPTQLKLSRNRHVRDYSREVGQHPVTARHANLTRTPISCSRQKDRMATTRQTGLLPSGRLLAIWSVAMRKHQARFSVSIWVKYSTKAC